MPTIAADAMIQRDFCIATVLEGLTYSAIQARAASPSQYCKNLRVERRDLDQILRVEVLIHRPVEQSNRGWY